MLPTIFAMHIHSLTLVVLYDVKERIGSRPVGPWRLETLYLLFAAPPSGQAPQERLEIRIRSRALDTLPLEFRAADIPRHSAPVSTDAAHA
jgi:hypothetical protein